MSLDPTKISLVHWSTDREKHKCGYCNNEAGSISYGMWAENLTAEDYQNLIDRGWRRSGKYCYKPIMHKTCCPQYTIRCEVENFKLSKSQKKVLKRFNKYLHDGELAQKDSQSPIYDNDGESFGDLQYMPSEAPVFQLDLNRIKNANVSTKVDMDGCVKVNCDVSQVFQMEQEMISSTEKPVTSQNVLKPVKKGVGADPTRPPCKKAKLLRLERKMLKQDGSMAAADKPLKNTEKLLGDFLAEVSADDKVQLRISLVPAVEKYSAFESTKGLVFELYKKYQICVHGDPPDKCSMNGFVRFLVSSPLRIDFNRMTPEHPSFDASAKLFAKYEQFVHDSNDFGVDTFVSFLVDSPVKLTKTSCPEINYGTFHQQYWLGDKLVAVGVLDILPKCVSSVYFFYDPDYRDLTLGTYGCLREIQFTKSLSAKLPTLKDYYLGYYIHSCQKMRYKGKLNPSYLLCPETYIWQPIDKCLMKLDANKYSRLCDNPMEIDKNRCSDEDVGYIRVLMNYEYCYFREFAHRRRYRDEFRLIGRLIGKQCALNLLFIISGEA